MIDERAGGEGGAGARREAAGRPSVIGVVVIAHGALATELVNATELILGRQGSMLAVTLAPDESIDSMKDRIGRAIQEVDKGRGVVVVTDMFGGTPSNLALTFHKEGKVEILMGVNLPMLLKLAGGRNAAEGEEPRSLAELVVLASEHGRKNIQVATEILKK